MMKCKYQIRHLNYVFQKGYPVLITSIGDYKKEGNTLIELITTYIHYNKDEVKFEYKFGSIAKLINSGVSIDGCFELGFENLINSATVDIYNSQNELQQKALPLTEESFPNSIFHRLKTSPAFKHLKEKVISKSFCSELKNDIEKHEPIEFKLNEE